MTWRTLSRSTYPLSTTAFGGGEGRRLVTSDAKTNAVTKSNAIKPTILVLVTRYPKL